MNLTILSGRLTKDPDIRYIAESQMAVATFTLAVDRPVTKDKEKKSDFIRITVFGKQAESCERFLAKGNRCSVQGRITTGSYVDKNGQTVYTTDVVAERVEFIDFKSKDSQTADQGATYGIPQGFQAITDSDIPF